MVACAPQPTQAQDAKHPLQVTTTVSMLTDLVRAIGGERVIVQGLMGPGVDPHLYKPTIGDVIKLDSADLVFYVGLHLEGRMAELFRNMGRAGKPVVGVGEAIDPSRLIKVSETEEAYDPHIWFDPTLWGEAAKITAQALGEADPEWRDIYRRNAEAYLAQLEALDAYIRERLAEIPAEQRVLITAHDAFGYFGARYSLEVIGLQGINTASEAGARDVQVLAELIAARRIKAIFVETSVSPATLRAVQAAVRARGWSVAIGEALFSDALGDEGTPEGTYLGMMRHNVEAIVRGLR
jgi:manganese/zinc/iron transport system substrate-binding protein